jgi:hypothetical protein
MSDKQDEKLERLLHARRIEPASPDLAQRIILQARQTPQAESMTVARWLNGLFKEFHLPIQSFLYADEALL